MKTQWSPRRRWQWGLGTIVLVALLGVGVWMLQSGRRMAARLAPPVPPATSADPAVPVPPTGVEVLRVTPAVGIEPTMRGVVRAPDGKPTGGAVVSVYRLLTSWPEWRHQERDLDHAQPGSDGAFQFHIPDLRGLLVHVKHPSYASAWQEVPLHGESIDIRLEPGFELAGVVSNDSGAPIANARVAVESVPGADRRCEVTTTSADGRYRFTNLAAGPVRLVARHEAWQPAVLPAIVVGDQRAADLRFAAPAASPLKGRVVAAGNGTPIAGATVELLPLNGKPGLVDAQTVRSDANGEFTVTGLARGSVRMLVRHADHGFVMMTHTVGVVAPPLVVELPRRSLVAGRLPPGDGARPWRGGEALRLRDAEGQLAFAQLAEDGTFRFAAPMSPGWASLRVLDRSFAFQRSFDDEVDLRIEEAVATDVELGAVRATVVRGRIVDAAGQPIAGASLFRTKPANARTLADAAAQFDLGAVGSEVARLFASDRDELIATAAADGKFAMRALKPGQLFVLVTARGHGRRLLRHQVGAIGSDTDLGDLRLEPGARLQGVVLRGRPFAGATVQVTSKDSPMQVVAVTDAAGRWAIEDLAPGDYQARARLPSQLSQKAVGDATEVRVGGPPVSVTLRLDAGRTVQGEVLGSDGPVAGATVSVRGVAGSSVVSDANGIFAIELPDKPVELQVALADRSRPQIVPVPLRQQHVLVQLKTPPTTMLTAVLAGLPGKQRLTSAVLRTRALDVADAEPMSRWIDAPDGLLRWPLCPAGAVRVEIWCDGYAPRVFELPAGAPRDLGEVVLERGCRVRGVVRRPDGRPAANALVMVGDELDLDLHEAVTRTADDGTFVVHGIGEASARLVVRAAGFAVRTVDLVLPRDALAPAPLPITLEEGASIEVRVEARVARDGGFVQLRRDGRLVANVEIGEDGRIAFANRSAGTYTVALLGDEAPAKTVVVEPASTVVRVQLP